MAEYHTLKLRFTNFVDLGSFAPILGITKIACALICLRKEGCSSYFYHAEEMSCVPSLTRHSNTKFLDHQNGYRYYTTHCTKNWEMFDGKCYYFEYEEMSFEQARKNCLEKGGYLAKTNSDAENDLFISLSQRGSFWLGGKKVQETWIWLDGSSHSSAYWAPDQPSGGVTCLHQWKGYGQDDDHCSESKYSLCEH